MRIFLQNSDRLCDRMFSYNRYPYNCASVQRALLAPESLIFFILVAKTMNNAGKCRLVKSHV